MNVESKSLEETRRIAAFLGETLKAGDVVALNGPLGVGKTAFVGGVARGMKIPPEYPVTSPTFVFARIYEGPLTLYHIDLYRVEKEWELRDIGIEEMLGTNGVAVVEWFERFPAVWDGDRLSIDMTFSPGGARSYVVTPVGKRGSEIVHAWEARCR